MRPDLSQDLPRMPGPPEQGRSYRLSVPGDRSHCRHATALCGCDRKTRPGRDYPIRDQNLNRSGRRHAQVAGGGRTGTAYQRFGRRGETEEFLTKRTVRMTLKAIQHHCSKGCRMPDSFPLTPTPDLVRETWLVGIEVSSLSG